MDAMSFSILHS